jgi:putative transcriptional regulator
VGLIRVVSSLALNFGKGKMSDSLRGDFLIACKGLRDPNFFKTVVLMVEDGPQGSMGLIVNRPSSFLVAHALSEHFKIPETKDLVYVGGPVEPTALFILHTFPDLEDESSKVIPGIFVGSSADSFATIVNNAVEGGNDSQFRIFSGCAGWAPGQLDSEIKRGDWCRQPATTELILHEDPYAVWDVLLEQVHEDNRTIPMTACNPEWN